MKRLSPKMLGLTLNTLLLNTIFTAPALAQSSSAWAAPAQKGVTSLTTTIVTFAGPLIGLSIVAIGIWAAMTQRIQWHVLWILLIAGILISAGPAFITWLINILQGGS